MVTLLKKQAKVTNNGVIAGDQQNNSETKGRQRDESWLEMKTCIFVMYKRN